MKAKNYIKVSILKSKLKLEDYNFKCMSRRNPQDFSRNRKMGFKNMMLFMLNMIKRTLQTELNNFFEGILGEDATMSKQAFSEARNKIKPEAFIELNNEVVSGLYDEAEDLELWNGYRLSAIDGSVLEIPNTKTLKKEFGVIRNQNGEVARARCACIFDILNKIIIHSKIDKYRASERNLAKDLIKQMNKSNKYNDLIIFDRGYPSAEMISFLYENNIDFLMRVRSDFSNQLVNARKKDQVIDIKYNDKSYPVRVIRVMISDEVEEVLMSSLMDEKIKPDDFKELYFKRWGIETKYNELKNRLQIENFTGATKIAVEQDFYASIYLSNMAEFARKHSDSIIKEKHADRNLKYTYRTNFNTLIGTLKDKLVMTLLEENDKKRNKMFMKIMNIISKSAVPIRLERKNPRKQFLIRSKYQLHKKRCL